MGRRWPGFGAITTVGVVECFAVFIEESSAGGFGWGWTRGAGEQRRPQNVQALWIRVLAGHGAGLSMTAGDCSPWVVRTAGGIPEASKVAFLCILQCNVLMRH